MKRRQKSKKELVSQELVSHVSVIELLEHFRLHALKEYGPMVLTVLSYWGINTSEDVGNMVFALVDAKFLTKTEEDTMEAFRIGFSFEEAFSQPFQPVQKK